jgi:hypothetical protein
LEQRQICHVAEYCLERTSAKNLGHHLLEIKLRLLDAVFACSKHEIPCQHLIHCRPYLG